MSVGLGRKILGVIIMLGGISTLASPHSSTSAVVTFTIIVGVGAAVFAWGYRAKTNR